MTTNAVDVPRDSGAALAVPWWPFAILGVVILVAAIGSFHRPAGAGELLVAAGQWRAGHVPIWDSAGGGRPLLAGGRVAVFSPTIVPLLSSSRWAWLGRDLLRLSLAGFGAAFVARLFVTRDPQVVGAGAYVVCCAVLAQFRDTAADAACWLPWGLVAITWAVERVTPVRVAVVALALAPAFSGGDRVSACAVGVVVVVFLLARAIQLRSPVAIVPVVFSILLGVGLTAAVWMTWWDATHRAWVPSSFSAPHSEWSVHDFKWALTRDAARRMAADPSFDPNRTVILDEEVAPDWANAVTLLKASPPSTRPSKPGFFSSGGGTLGVSVNHVPLTTGRAQVGGWLVVAQAYDAGWTAHYVQTTPLGRTRRDKAILPADGGLLAIPMHDEGTGTLELEYRPAAWRRGAIVSAACAVVVMLLLGMGVAEPGPPGRR